MDNYIINMYHYRIARGNYKLLLDYLRKKVISQQKTVTIYPLTVYDLLKAMFSKKHAGLMQHMDLHYVNSCFLAFFLSLLSRNYTFKKINTTALFIDLIDLFCKNKKYLFLMGSKEKYLRSLRTNLKRLQPDVIIKGTLDTETALRSFKDTRILIDKVAPALLVIGEKITRSNRTLAALQDKSDSKAGQQLRFFCGYALQQYAGETPYQPAFTQHLSTEWLF
ncbi:MAG TPA: WecB/TagA/CpsF family glycosyltransferase, partial [Spirochaetota bacterium]|nr:WecB/TagA/CpsF family glycosyltransferase [Spirochaetota bacterium]